jgi:hypothetical protein
VPKCIKKEQKKLNRLTPQPSNILDYITQMGYQTYDEIYDASTVSNLRLAQIASGLTNNEILTNLTPRQREIAVYLICSGLSISQTARALNISHVGVIKHIKLIAQKALQCSGIFQSKYFQVEQVFSPESLVDPYTERFEGESVESWFARINEGV